MSMGRPPPSMSAPATSEPRQSSPASLNSMSRPALCLDLAGDSGRCSSLRAQLQMFFRKVALQTMWPLVLQAAMAPPSLGAYLLLHTSLTQ